MNEDKLGPMPEPGVDPPPGNPGGADAVNADPPFAGDEDKLPRDLHPERNPGVEDHVPDEIGQSEDKVQEGNDSDGATDPEKEDPV